MVFQTCFFFHQNICFFTHPHAISTNIQWTQLVHVIALLPALKSSPWKQNTLLSNFPPKSIDLRRGNLPNPALLFETRTIPPQQSKRWFQISRTSEATWHPPPHRLLSFLFPLLAPLKLSQPSGEERELFNFFVLTCFSRSFFPLEASQWILNGLKKKVEKVFGQNNTPLKSGVGGVWGKLGLYLGKSSSKRGKGAKRLNH